MRKAKAAFQSIRAASSSSTQTQQTLNLQTLKMEQSKTRYTYDPSLRWNPQVEEYFIKAYGSEHFSRISSALTCPSCYSCIRVNTLKTTSDAIVEKLLSILRETGNQSDTDALNKTNKTATMAGDMGHKHWGFSNGLNCHESSNHCANGALKLSTDENVCMKELQRFPVTKCQEPGLHHVVFVKGSGPHTLSYGNAPNTPLKEIIVSRKCAEAVLRGAKVFVPGVLACSAHVEKGDTVAVSVAIEQPGLDNGWSVGITRGTVLQGLQTDPQYFERDGMYIGQGIAMMSRAGIFRASEGVAVEMTNRVFDLPSFHDVLEGEIFLQNLPSIVTAHVLDPQKGERILDMCAAPGGKTTAIATLMKDEGEVVAVDRSHNKVLEIKKLAAEMGLNCITAYKLDALKAVCHRKGETEVSSGQSEAVSLVGNEEINDIQGLSKSEIRKSTRKMKNGPGRNHTMGGRVETSKGFPPNSFDRILLDAPCSALGLRPRLFAGEETVESLRNHGKYQRRMFDQAIQLVRPGGVIVYSTCTINPGENETLVRYALDTYKFLTLASQSPRIGGPGIVGRCGYFDGEYVEEWLRPGEEELVQRFDPSSSLDTIGFFIAKFNVGEKAT